MIALGTTAANRSLTSWKILTYDDPVPHNGKVCSASLGPARAVDLEGLTRQEVVPVRGGRLPAGHQGSRRSMLTRRNIYDCV